MPRLVADSGAIYRPLVDVYCSKEKADTLFDLKSTFDRITKMQWFVLRISLTTALTYANNAPCALASPLHSPDSARVACRKACRKWFYHLHRLCSSLIHNGTYFLLGCGCANRRFMNTDAQFCVRDLKGVCFVLFETRIISGLFAVISFYLRALCAVGAGRKVRLLCLCKTRAQWGALA